MYCVHGGGGGGGHSAFVLWRYCRIFRSGTDSVSLLILLLFFLLRWNSFKNPRLCRFNLDIGSAGMFF